MRTEREIAELIFDKFRFENCKAGNIVMMGTIRFSLIDKLNPKEKELFNIVFVGLQITGYYTYESGSPECLRLTQKGYDYIYDNEMVSKMLNTPWIIPGYGNTDWNKAYNKLWKIIGPQDDAMCYVKGSKFYDLLLKFSDEIPPSYSQYIELLRKKGLSTNRVDYYKELIDSLTDEQRIHFYGAIQMFIEDKYVFNNSMEKEKSMSKTGCLSLEDDKEVNVNTSGHMTEKHPIVAISYSWDNKKHENWVLKLATDLQSKYGIEIILDKWEIKLGRLLPNFMEHAIRDSQRVICVMTPNYKKKTEQLSGGVGVEYSIISAEIQKNIKTEKFIPLFREGNIEDIPTFLSGRDFIDMRDDSKYDEEIENLARDIWNEPKYKKPKLGTKPKFD